ncbi:MAG: sulfatase-like hydrolase/transferase [Deltaproteobacteria bacterium]|nr:sulfatase-like hydrolase/transferase [Deltaproteobacteria bacterium]
MTLELTFRYSSPQFLQGLDLKQIFISFSGLFVFLTVPALIWALVAWLVFGVLGTERLGRAGSLVACILVCLPFGYLGLVYLANWIYSTFRVDLAQHRDLWPLLSLVAVVCSGTILWLRAQDLTALFYRGRRAIIAGWFVLGMPFIFFSAVDRADQPNPNSCGRCDKYNVIIITGEGLNSEDLSVYGYPLKNTPFLEELAQESCVFTRAYSNANKSRASLATLFTGTSPFTHGVIGATGAVKVDQKYCNLPFMLKEHGFLTADYTHYHRYAQTQWTDPHLSNLGNSFTIVQNNKKRGGISAMDSVEKTLARDTISVFWLETIWRDAVVRLAPETEQADFFSPLSSVVELIRQRKHRLFIHMHDLSTHTLYEPHGYWPRLRRFSAGSKDWRPRYDDTVHDFDDNVRTVVHALKQSGTYDRTLLVVTSDHRRNWKNDGGAIPLIIRFPGQNNGKTITTPVSLMDIAATILEFLDMPIPSTMEGESLLPLVENGVTRRQKHIFSFGDYNRMDQSWFFLLGDTRESVIFGTVIKDDFVFIRTVDGKLQRLFDSRSSKDDTIDLSRQMPAKTEEMLGIWQSEIARYHDLVGL